MEVSKFVNDMASHYTFNSRISQSTIKKNEKGLIKAIQNANRQQRLVAEYFYLLIYFKLRNTLDNTGKNGDWDDSNKFKIRSQGLSFILDPLTIGEKGDNFNQDTGTILPTKKVVDSKTIQCFRRSWIRSESKEYCCDIFLALLKQTSEKKEGKQIAIARENKDKMYKIRVSKKSFKDSEEDRAKYFKLYWALGYPDERDIDILSELYQRSIVIYSFGRTESVVLKHSSEFQSDKPPLYVLEEFVDDEKRNYYYPHRNK